jgi:enediyne polyketide synthase
MHTVSEESLNNANAQEDYITGFASSVHLENPLLKVRVINVSDKSDSRSITFYWSQENALGETFNKCFFDLQDNRYLFRSHLVNLKTQKPRNLSWSKKDVFLITGGAKGITSECCIALAMETGGSMALVGSSPVPEANDLSSEINLTLQKLKSLGIACQYYRCDITDATDVKALINKITEELGSITGFIHGAGVNKPRRVDTVSFEEAFAEIAPKVLGGMNVLKALEASPLKLLVGFTSIIGITGMPGNAWYAFSNALLNQIFIQFGKAFNHIHVQQIAYSVWNEVGMGAKLGSVKGLAKIGIGSIPTKDGVNKFIDLITFKPESHQVVVAAKLGGLDTWRCNESPLPVANRFVQDIRVNHPGIELVSRTHLNVSTDLYLLDHNYRGSYLFPTVLGLEAMAQNVACALGIQSFSSVLIENIQLRRPIVVDEVRGANIEIRIHVDEINSSDGLLR